MAFKKLKVPWHCLLIPISLFMLFFESIASVTIRLLLYHQFVFKIIGGSFIVNLILLGKCGTKYKSWKKKKVDRYEGSLKDK